MQRNSFQVQIFRDLKKTVETSIRKWRVFIHRFLNFLQKNHNLWIRNKKKNCFIFVLRTPEQNKSKTNKIFLTLRLS